MQHPRRTKSLYPSIQHYNHRANGRPVELIPDAAAPLGIIVQGGTDVDLRLTTSVGGPVPLAARPLPQRNPNHASVTALQRFVRLPAGGSLTLAGLGIAILLGALHALTPGHGKTLVAAYLRTGKMDFLLALPVNTRFIVSLRVVDLGAFVNAAFGLCVLIFAAHKAELQPTFMQMLGFSVLCGVGVMIHYSLMFMLAAISFWTVRAQGIVWGYYNLFNIARMPDEAFRGAFKAVFTFALPVLLVSNVPTRVLANTLDSWHSWLLLLGVGVMWAIISEWFWRISLRRYASASS